MDLDDKHQLEIEKREKQRGEGREQLTAALAQKDEELAACKTRYSIHFRMPTLISLGRYEAASARSRTLEGEVRNLKGKMKVNSLHFGWL